MLAMGMAGAIFCEQTQDRETLLVARYDIAPPVVIGIFEL